MRRTKLYYIRLSIASVVFCLAIAAFCGFYPVKIFDVQFIAVLQNVWLRRLTEAGIILALLVLITLLFGRIYCSTLCPLGFLQELFMLIGRRHTAVSCSRSYKYFLAALMFGVLAGGSICLLRWLDPYALFGKGMSGTWPGIGVFFVLAVLVRLKGRFFCANICPVGTILGLLAKYSWFKIYIAKDKCLSCGLCSGNCPTGSIDYKKKTVNNETCIKCFRCLNTCSEKGLHYGIPPQKSVAFNPDRRRLLTGVAVVAVFAVAAKKGINISKIAAKKIKQVILPAGSDNPEVFAERCLNCNLCVQNCPMKILKKANGEYPAVHIDYQSNFCDYDCHKCAEVCPSGAIKRLSLAEKQKTQIGLAVINKDKCIKCGLCVMKCPRGIINKEAESFPEINSEGCIGCGTCKIACPVKAIKIIPLKEQKVIK